MHGKYRINLLTGSDTSIKLLKFTAKQAEQTK